MSVLNLMVGGKNLTKWRDAIARSECMSKASDMGHDPEAAKRICDAISSDAPNVMDRAYPDGPVGQGHALDEIQKQKKKQAAASDKMIEQCAKMKMRKDQSLSEEDATKACQDAFDSGNKSGWFDPRNQLEEQGNQPSENEPDMGDEEDNPNELEPDEDVDDQDTQADYTENLGYGENGSGNTHDLGNDGPNFDTVATLDNNDHIDSHMSPQQKDMHSQLDDMEPSIDAEETANKTDVPDLPDQAEGDSKNQTPGMKVKTVMPDFKGPIIAGSKSQKQKQLVKNAQVEPFESNGRFFVKAFLLDTSLNANNWGVSAHTLDANINSYIGKPLVLTEKFDHPDSGDPNLDHALLYQELYRIGSIVDIVKKGTRYDAVCEITDPYAIDAWRQGEIPLFVSPQLYKEDAAEPDNGISKWQGTHLALVRDPAFGAKLATFTGSCTGESDKCLAQLKKASIIEAHGYGSCGYCNRKLLLSAMAAAAGPSPLQHKTHDTPENEPKVNYPPGYTSLEQNSVSTTRNKTLPEPTKSSSAVAEIDSYQKKIASLEQKLAIALKSNEEKDNVNVDLAKRMAALETEHRRDKVAAILSAAGIIEKEGFEERVNSLAKSNLPIEEIHSIYQPYVEAKNAANLKGASNTSIPEQAPNKKEVQYVESKVTMKNAATETAAAPIQKPAWLATRDYLMEGVA